MTTSVLLTLDEARDLLGTSALAVVDAVSCSPARLARLLAGKGSLGALPPAARRAVRAHRGVVQQILACDHAWILDEQLEGALSYAEHNGARSSQTVAA